LHRQQLLQPLVLETSAADELAIESHLDIFDSNGFKIEIDNHASPGSRVKILTLPYSKTTHFDKNDVLELASLLSDSNEQVTSKLIVKNQGRSILCPKLMAMFASRACRTSVMIGTHLSSTEMRSIIQNLEVSSVSLLHRVYIY
jgi:DNA mismatch repair protein PMS2